MVQREFPEVMTCAGVLAKSALGRGAHSNCTVLGRTTRRFLCQLSEETSREDRRDEEHEQTSLRVCAVAAGSVVVDTVDVVVSRCTVETLTREEVKVSKRPEPSPRTRSMYHEVKSSPVATKQSCTNAHRDTAYSPRQ